MTKLICAWTGTEMWVADDRVDEYLGQGHTLAPSTTKKPIEEVPVTEPKAEPKVEELKVEPKAPKKKPIKKR